MNNRIGFANAPNVWTEIEHNMFGRQAAWSLLWWWPCCYCNTTTTTFRLRRAHFPGSGLVIQGNVSVVAAAQSCSSFLPIRGGIARLSRPRAIVCKFSAHRNYAVTRVSATEFEPGTVQLWVQRATTVPPRHTCGNSTLQMICSTHCRCSHQNLKVNYTE